MPHNEPRAAAPPARLPIQESSALDARAFLDHVFHELSQPVSALWCALEVAAMRAPDPEEDRQDLLAAFAVVEELGKKLRHLQHEADARLRHSPEF